MQDMENFLQEDALVKKWAPILEHSDLGSIQDPYRKAVTAVLLENQDNNKHLHEAAPTNVTGGVSKWDPVLMGLVRRAMPSMIAFDIAGVQPMNMPTGLVFALRSRYDSQAGAEALFDEANTAFSGTGTHSLGAFTKVLAAATVTSLSTTVTVTDTTGLAAGMIVIGAGIPADTTVASVTDGTTFELSAAATATGTPNLTVVAVSGGGVDTATGEGDISAQMAVSIEKIQVGAQTRALKAEYSVEMAQDMQAVHGLDAETELANILSNEILSEINREFLRTLYGQAKLGANATTVPGIFDVSADADGRWSAERFKGLHFQIERDANQIALDTRRGKGNILVCSADVASALAMANILSPVSGLNAAVSSDWTQSTFVGTIGAGIKVYVDPYAQQDFYMLGYKGTSPFDAGYFYCPYVPLQMYRAVDQASFQPKIAFKTRYGKIANPFFQGGTRTNGYYRIAEVANIL